MEVEERISRLESKVEALESKDAIRSLLSSYAVAVDGILCDLVRTIASNKVKVSCLIPPASDPHFYRFTPSDRISVGTADIIFHNGYQLTPVVNRLPSNILKIAVNMQDMRGLSP